MPQMRYWFLNPATPSATVGTNFGPTISAATFRKRSRAKKLLPL
jgi:hypothetical protein